MNVFSLSLPLPTPINIENDICEHQIIFETKLNITEIIYSVLNDLQRSTGCHLNDYYLLPAYYLYGTIGLKHHHSPHIYFPLMWKRGRDPPLKMSVMTGYNAGKLYIVFAYTMQVDCAACDWNKGYVTCGKPSPACSAVQFSLSVGVVVLKLDCVLFF